MPSTLDDVLTNRATWHVETADVLAGLARLPADSVQCVVTSPPYWGLRDYGVAGQLGLEPTPDEFLASMVDVFEAVRRVLRPDGTLWLNIGDSYNTYNGGAGPASKFSKTQTEARPDLATGFGRRCKTLKPKDLIGIPWELALALRGAGWYLRSEIIWHKRSPMPESIRDRPTKAHEQIFLLAKSERYFYDAVASAEPQAESTLRNFRNGHTRKAGAKNAIGTPGEVANNATNHRPQAILPNGRNMRTVWTLSTEPYKEAHFATYPTELVRRCLLAGTSAHGACPTCGAPWKRQTKPTAAYQEKLATANDRGDWYARTGTNTKRDDGRKNGSPNHGKTATRDVETTGWKPECNCEGNSQTIPCLVLDPFNGAGTTGVTARRLGLRYVGLELNPEYAEMARQRIAADQPLLNARPA